MLLYFKETMNETDCMLKTSKNVLLVHGMLQSVEKYGPGLALVTQKVGSHLAVSPYGRSLR